VCQCISAQFGKDGSTAKVACWLAQSPPSVVSLQVGKKGTAEDVAEALAAKAQEAGSTDDVTVVALKLG
jgi:serine/threonine protein phosphatase PrpC